MSDSIEDFCNKYHIHIDGDTVIMRLPKFMELVSDLNKQALEEGQRLEREARAENNE